MATLARFKDLDGREITAINPKQQQRIETEINSQTTQQFKYDSNGKLQPTGGANSGGSPTYTKAINDGISSKTNIRVGIQQTYKDSSGKTTNIDKANGGGLTGKTSNGDLVVLISGNPLKTVDASGAKITDSPADILRHEFVGHAVPQATGPALGNAIANDNVTRGELGKPMLPSDPTHTEK